MIEFPRARAIELMAHRMSADLIEVHELTETAAAAGSDARLDDLTGVMPGYHHSDRFMAELHHRIDLMERAYNRDARLYQRIVGELVGGSLTPLLEDERAGLRHRLDERAGEASQKTEIVVERLLQEHTIRQMITTLHCLRGVVAEKEQDLHNEQQHLSAEIETQQAAGEQALTTVNEVIRRYNWMPSSLLSTNILFRLSILIGLTTLGFVLGLLWNFLVAAITGLLSAGLGIWLMLMRRMPPPEIIEPNLRAYYRAFGQRIHLEEQLAFWTQVSGRLEETRQRLDVIVEELRRQYHELTMRWQALHQQLLSPPRHITYLLDEQELQVWYQELHAVETHDLLQAFRHTCLASGSNNAVYELLQRIRDQLDTRFQWTAEERLQTLYGDRAPSVLFGDGSSLLNRTFTLAVRFGKLLHRSRYHRSFFIGLRQPARSQLVSSLKHLLKQNNLGAKFVENGDPYRITVLGLEGGFTIRSLREGSELHQNFREHQYDPLIYPKIRSRQK